MLMKGDENQGHAIARPLHDGSFNLRLFSLYDANESSVKTDGMEMKRYDPDALSPASRLEW